MRLNEALSLAGDAEKGRGVTLIPYQPQHVCTYHGWMQDAELLEATASEQLTLEEEEANCRSWHADAGKLTFILTTPEHGLVGDVNLFLDPHEPDTAEVSIMVAVPAARRGGVALEALRLLQAWAARALHIRRFVAKIGLDNQKSGALFRRAGYARTGVSEVFQEETLELCVSGEEDASFLRELPYPCAWSEAEA